MPKMLYTLSLLLNISFHAINIPKLDIHYSIATHVGD
uniref:Uncharacterized protein n=1 Tax=Rhizophora mucronata TaxID=61149 RepID=A0A2P2JC21_RHIMU